MVGCILICDIALLSEPAVYSVYCAENMPQAQRNVNPALRVSGGRTSFILEKSASDVRFLFIWANV